MARPAESDISTRFDPPMPNVDGVNHRFVNCNGLRMHVAEAGAGDPVLLLHGFPQHWFMWHKVIPPLAEQYRVIAPDLRGFGWTDAPSDSAGYDKRNMANDLLKLLDALEIDKPVKILGHDWGGWCGFILSVNAPERVERYLACNISPPWSDPHPRNLGSLLRLWYQVMFASPMLGRYLIGGGGRRMTAKVARRSPNGPKSVGTEFPRFLDQFDDPARTRAGILLYRRFLTRELPQLMSGRYLRGRRLTVPTRILFGTGDFAISTKTITADHARHADDLTVELVSNCGHFIVDERPELVADRALAWFGHQ